MLPRLSRRAVLLSLTGAVSCGVGLPSATQYSGRSGSPLASAAQIRQLGSLPVGYERLGEATARCRVTEGLRELRGELLSDVDCSEVRLVQALRERASSVGGELLVGLECGSQVHRREQREYDVRCRADVGRPTQATLARRPMQSSVALMPGAVAPDAGVGSDAWRIQVDFVPEPGDEVRPPRSSEHVSELPVLPPNHVRLGDVVTRCEKGCSRASVRDGLLTVAGRMGGSAVVDIHCARQGAGVLCAGTAAGYAVDPDLHPEAR